MVSDWAQGGVADCVALKLIEGFEDNTFRPDGVMTRAQGATVLSRMVNSLS